MTCVCAGDVGKKYQEEADALTEEQRSDREAVKIFFLNGRAIKEGGIGPAIKFLGFFYFFFRRPEFSQPLIAKRGWG